MAKENLEGAHNKGPLCAPEKQAWEYLGCWECSPSFPRGVGEVIGKCMSKQMLLSVSTLIQSADKSTAVA